MIQKERADVIERVKQLDQAVLLPVVRAVLNDDSATLTSSWSIGPIGGSVGVGTLGIFKLSGQAESVSRKKPWSVIAKVMDLTASSEHSAATSPAREIQAYDCGLLTQISSTNPDRAGLRAAKYYGNHEITDLGTILWVEDLSAAPPPPWDDVTYLEIVRQVGQFNATWELNPPVEPFWFIDDLKAIETDPRLEWFATIGDYLDDPIVKIASPPTVVENLMSLPDLLGRALALLDEGPKPLSHLDIQPRNVFPVKLKNGAFESVLIDWASIGYAPLGSAAMAIVGSSMTWCDIDSEHGVRLHPQALSSYLAGLEEGGWHGDIELVRLAYMTSAVIRAAGNAMFPVMWVNEPAWKPYTANLMNKTPEELVPHWRDVFEGVYPLFMKELAAMGAD